MDTESNNTPPTPPPQHPTPTLPTHTTLFLQDGYFYNAEGTIAAIAITDLRVSFRRPAQIVFTTALVVGLTILAFSTVPVQRNANIPWFHMSVILAACVLVLVSLFVITPRRLVRLHTASPDSMSPGELMLTLEEATHPVRDRRETRVFDASGKHMGTLTAKPITALTTFTWTNAENTPLATAREASTMWNKAARLAEQNMIALSLRNLFTNLWHRKITPHTTRYWNLTPAADPATPTTPTPSPTPTTSPAPTPPMWAQVQHIQLSPMPIHIMPTCPADLRLIPLVLAESLAKHTFGWSV